MHTDRERGPGRRRAAGLAGWLLGLLLTLASTASAQPLPWAPARDHRAGPAPVHGHVARQDDDGGHTGRGRSTRIGRDHQLAGGCNGERLGAAAGGAIGGLLGSRIGEGDGGERTVAIVAGTLIGMLVGSSIGRHIDGGEERCLGEVLEGAPDGQVVAWRDPDTGARFEAEPPRTYRRDGRYCRDFRARMQAVGNLRHLDGTACRRLDGSWRTPRGGWRHRRSSAATGSACRRP